MNIEALLAPWIEEAPALIGSVVAVSLMVGVAYALGFRATAQLTDAELARLAGAEGASLEGAVIAPNARAAFARLSGDKVMIARAMGADLSARAAPARDARVKLKGEKLSVAFADTGYPPLHMRVAAAPPWLVALAAGDRP